MKRGVSWFRFTIIAFALGLFLVSFLGFSHGHMAVNGQISSGNCFAPGMADTLCQMHPLEHIAKWQSLFVTTSSQSEILLFLTTLLSVGGLAVLSIFDTRLTGLLSATQQKIFSYYKQRILIAQPLQEAFSNGIIHSKVF